MQRTRNQSNKDDDVQRTRNYDSKKYDNQINMKNKINKNKYVQNNKIKNCKYDKINKNKIIKDDNCKIDKNQVNKNDNNNLAFMPAVIAEIKEKLIIREKRKRSLQLFDMFDDYVGSCYWYNLPRDNYKSGYYDKNEGSPKSKTYLMKWCLENPDEFTVFFEQMKIDDFNRMNKYKSIKYN